MLTTRAWVSRSRWRTTAEPINPAPPVTKMVEPLKRMIECLRRAALSLEGTIHRHQIFAIAALGGLLRHFGEGVERDIALAQRDLLGAGDAQTLALLQDLHEMAGLDQRGMRAGVRSEEHR